MPAKGVPMDELTSTILMHCEATRRSGIDCKRYILERAEGCA